MSERASARWALAPAPERPSRGREYEAASVMQGCAAPRLVDFQRLRPASGRRQGGMRAPTCLHVPCFTRAEYRGGGRRRDHEATIGRAILPVRATGRGWRRDGGTIWKWLDMTEEEITEIPKYNASSDILSSIHKRRCSKSRPEAGSQPHKKARRTHRDVQ